MSPARRFWFMAALIVAGETVFGLPFVVARVFRPTLLDVFEITNFELGAAMSVYGLLAMLSYFPGGPLADRFSARKLIAVALWTTALGGLIYARIPGLRTLTFLFAFWGITTILLFWAAMLRATREWGGADNQGRAFGVLDGGRGLVAALLGSLTVWVFAVVLGADPDTATLAERTAALSQVIVVFTGATALAGVFVWFAVPENSALPSLQGRDPYSSFSWKKAMAVLRVPGLWLQAAIVVCAYVGYKSTDDLPLYARDGFGMNDVEAASVGAFGLYLRPVAAIAAGLLADRFSGSGLLMASFSALAILTGAIGMGVLAGSPVALFLIVVAGTCAAVYALRAVYFALFEEAAIPRAFTGTAVGLVSVVGFTPDIFFGPLMGFLTDRSPGALGHQHLFAVVSFFATVGLLASVAFRKSSAKRRKNLAA